MGYSTNPQTLEEIRPQLYKLERGEPDIFYVKPPLTAAKWAYQIREAFYIARRYPLRYPELANAAQKFKVQVEGESRVRVTPKNSFSDDLVSSGQRVSSLTVAPSSLTADQIIATVEGNQHKEKISFEAILPKEELVRLLLWCQQTQPRRILLVGERDISLVSESPNITSDLEWSPEDE